MAIAHLSYVICDICGAPAPVEDNARTARIAATKAGFVSVIREHDGGRVTLRHDFCRAHTAHATPDREEDGNE
jgi:hypothetical protein